MNLNHKENGCFVGFLTQEQEKEMADRYIKGESSKALAKEYGFKNGSSVLEKVHKYYPNYKENGFCQFYSVEEEKKIAQEYIESNIPITELMEKYGFKTRKSITDKVKKYFPDYDIEKNNRERVKDYHLDFEEIDTNFKAYFLGLMLTDGYLTDEIRFGIDLTDKDCIEFISRQTGHDYKAYNYNKDNFNKFYDRMIKRKTRYRIIFSNRKNCQQLKKWGVTFNKTYTLKGPNLELISPKFYPYILRGIIDGDGWITDLKNPGSIGTFGVITASKDFAEWINNLCIKLGMDEMCIYFVPPRCTETPLYRVYTAKNKNLTILHNVVYKNKYGMQRKRNKLRKMFRDYNGSSSIEE